MMLGEILSGLYMVTGKNEMSRRKEEFIENPSFSNLVGLANLLPVKLPTLKINFCNLLHSGRDGTLNVRLNGFLVLESGT
jgi:hypothetical protein